jgi:cytochrome P450
MAEPVTLSMVRQRTFDAPPALEDLLRSGHSVHRLRFRGGAEGWLVTGYREARAVLNDPRLGLRRWRPLLTEDPEEFAAIVEMMERRGLLAGNLLVMDPPDHTRMRRTLAPRFTSKSIGELSGRIEAVVDRCLDEMEAAGPPVDLVEAFADRIPLLGHCVLLGVPESDIPMLELLGTITDPEMSGAEVVAVFERIREYLQEVVARKRAEPGEDLLTHIVAAELGEEEILGILVLLFVAGLETTASMLGTGAFALLCHGEQLELLRRDPGAVDAAVEELMRYLTVFNAGAQTRTALEDIELDGATIRAGDPVSVSLLAANRDGERFERPDQLDIARGGRGQVGFGHGIHVCLGQHLARLEMRIAFTRLLARFPELRLAVPAEEVPLSGELDVTFAVRRLPVAW